MFIDRITKGSRVFIDTNIFLYHISEHSIYGRSCTEFLNRIENGEIKGVTSVVVLNELLHKLILAEVVEKRGLKLYRVIDYIKRNPNVLENLKTYDIVQGVGNLGNLRVYDLRYEYFNTAMKFMKEFSLLSNDALHIAVMKIHNIKNLASNDPDFERVDWINLYKPSKS